MKINILKFQCKNFMNKLNTILYPTREHIVRRQKLVGFAHPSPKYLEINCKRSGVVRCRWRHGNHSATARRGRQPISTNLEGIFWPGRLA